MSISFGIPSVQVGVSNEQQYLDPKDLPSLAFDLVVLVSVSHSASLHLSKIGFGSLRLPSRWPSPLRSSKPVCSDAYMTLSSRDFYLYDQYFVY